jgi:hypothetical protein
MLLRAAALLAAICLILPGSAAAQLRTYRITQVTFEDANHLNPSINDLGQVGWCMAQGDVYQSFFTLTEGLKLLRASCIAAAGANFREMVWTQNVAGFSQVFSSQRGQVTRDRTDHLDPAVNSQGEIVWVQRVGGRTQMNNLGEIVQPVDYISQVFSSRRGQLTFAAKDHLQPTVNDAGEVVWIEKLGGYWQVVSSINGPITADPADHFTPRLNNTGTVVWSQRWEGISRSSRPSPGCGSREV